MKLVLISLMASLLTTAAHAETRELNIYRDSAMTSAAHTHIKMTDAQLVHAPKVIELVPALCHSDSEVHCTRAKVLESVPVVQVKVEYRDNSMREENSYTNGEIVLNLPTSDFSDDQIAELKSATHPGYKNIKARKAWMNDNLQLEVTKVSKSTRVLDESRSKLCEREYAGEIIPNCEESRVYRSKTIYYKQIKVSSTGMVNPLPQ